MRKKISVFVLIILLLVQGAVLGIRYMENQPTDFSKVSLTAYQDDFHYYYKKLSKPAQQAYVLILDAVHTHPKEIEIPALTGEELNALTLALSYDNPDLLCLSNENKMITRGAKNYFSPQYAMDAKTCEAQGKALESKAESVCAAAKNLSAAYEKELFFHDYLCSHVTYDAASPIGYSSYNALIDGKTVCEGYARAMQLLLTREHIPNYLVIGQASGQSILEEAEGHMWNVVTLPSGNYYVDVTWDDLDEKKFNAFHHVFFNVTDAQIGKDHKEISPQDNACNAKAENYFAKEKLLFSAYNADTKQKITEKIRSAVKQENKNFEIQFTSVSAYRQAKKELLTNGEFFDLLKRADKTAYKKYKNIAYIDMDAFYTIQFIFEEKE